MKDKLNVAELLKDCPKGMELDCTMYDDVTFNRLQGNEYIIINRDYNGGEVHLTKFGQMFNSDDAKCVIFPKGKTTWEGFVPPCKFKDGDVVYIKTKGYNHNEFIIIFKEIKNNHIHKHACFAYQVLYTCKNAVCHLVDVEIMRLATEEEKAKLFDAIKDNGYKWNAETKTLEMLIEPKFQVGDRIRNKKTLDMFVITHIDEDSYYCGLNVFWICDQDDYELVPNKFDINTLKPFESRVLVRNKNHYKWEGAVFGRYDGNTFFTIGGNDWIYCIPYEGNEHLLGKTNDCNDFYKTWN